MVSLKCYFTMKDLYQHFFVLRIRVQKLYISDQYGFSNPAPPPHPKKVLKNGQTFNSPYLDREGGGGGP